MIKKTGQRKPVSAEAAVVRLESLCARSEQCSHEILRKLSSWMVPSDESEKILKSLVDRRFVDDARYARSFVRDKYRFARWGRRKIEIGLRAKRINRENIEEAMKEIDEKEYIANLQHILTAKMASMTDADSYEGRTRLFRFGASRGFEPELVAAEIRSMIRNS